MTRVRPSVKQKPRRTVPGLAQLSWQLRNAPDQFEAVTDEVPAYEFWPMWLDAFKAGHRAGARSVRRPPRKARSTKAIAERARLRVECDRLVRLRRPTTATRKKPRACPINRLIMQEARECDKLVRRPTTKRSRA